MIGTNLQDVIDDIKGMSAYQLANIAATSSPDALDSVGADWLDTVRVSALEVIEWHAGNEDRRPDEDSVTETADGCVPIYTHHRMRVLVDLAAYGEDVEDIAGDSGDMTIEQLAGLALFLVADRLTAALIVMAQDAYDEDELDA